MIVDIICDYKEFRLTDDKRWMPTDSQRYLCVYASIEAVIESTQYVGGSTHSQWRPNRRYGLVPKHYEVTSECGRVKRIYDFNYDRSYDDETK